MSGVKEHLQVYHNPFAGATEQPKIPDGAATHSIGFSTQAVGEATNRVSDVTDTMEFLLYPGMTSGLIINDTASAAIGSRQYFIPGFTASNNIDFTATANGVNTQTVSQRENYAKWRLVSCGLQLKLLNASETDDGWWEAIRVRRLREATDWRLTTSNNQTAAGTDDGTIAPTQLVNTLSGAQLVNEPSYMTGLMRDLHKVQFELHPTINEHKFKTCEGDFRVSLIGTAAQSEQQLADGTDAEGNRLLEQMVDWDYDMIYIRCHCRPRPTESPGIGSRIHYNVVSNQEIIYSYENKFARYMTRCPDIGPAMEPHNALRRKNGGTANMIMPAARAGGR
jgi:hypothetical protein